MQQNTLHYPHYDAAQLQRVQKCPLRIAVVGHADAGKTSIIRTLCRTPEWGEVSDYPGTTKKVTGVKFKIASKTYMIIFDTPGFQNSTTAIEELGDQFTIESIRHFFQRRQDFSDDSKALEQLLRSDVLLYVIDCAGRPTENLQADFRVLTRSGIPVIPLMNFTKDENSEDYKAWLACLQQNGLFLDVKYDAHYYRPECEHELYEKIRVLLKNPLHREFFKWHVAWREIQERNMAQNAVASMAEMLLDCAAYRHSEFGVEPNDKDAMELTAIDYYQKAIAARESSGFQNMVVAYEFKPDLLENTTDSEDHEVLWKQDFFGKEIQNHMGIGLAAGAASGAAIGVTADLLAGGTSFFTFGVLGGVVGAVLGSMGAGLYSNNYDDSSHTITIGSTEKMRSVLIERALLLFKSLQHRGMADQREFVVSDTTLRGAKADSNNLLAKLAEVAEKPSFSLIDVDRKEVSKQVVTDRKTHLVRIEALIKTLASKVEDTAR